MTTETMGPEKVKIYLYKVGQVFLKTDNIWVCDARLSQNNRFQIITLIM
jgi:hypothetical protein